MLIYPRARPAASMSAASVSTSPAVVRFLLGSSDLLILTCGYLEELAAVHLLTSCRLAYRTYGSYPVRQMFTQSMLLQLRAVHGEIARHDIRHVECAECDDTDLNHLHHLASPYTRRLRSYSDPPLPAIVCLPRVMRLRELSYLPLLHCTPHLTHLQLSIKDHHKPVMLDLLPASLIKLSMGLSFNQSLHYEQLCHLDRLLSLSLPGRFNQPLPAHLFPRLLTLSFAGCSNFNQPIGLDMLPATLVSLHLGDSFNQSLSPGVLPQSLLHLRFGRSHNQPLCDGVLPASLLTVKLGDAFNHSLSGMFESRSQLTALCIGDGYSTSFNKSIHPGSLPPGLTMLSMGWDGAFNQPLLPDSIPSSLTALQLCSPFNQPLSRRTLASATALVDLELGSSFTQEINPGVLPATLRFLGLGEHYHRRTAPGALPGSLQQITIPTQHFDRNILPSTLPDGLLVIDDSTVREHDKRDMAVFCLSSYTPPEVEVAV